MTRRSIAVVVAVAVVLVAVPLLFGHRSYDTNDDYRIATLLDGRLSGSKVGQLVFVNPALGYPLSALYRLAGLPWYPLALYLLLALSLVVIGYSYVRTGTNLPATVLLLVTGAVVVPRFALAVSFTTIALLLGGAAVLLFVFGRWPVGAGLLFGLAGLLRWNSMTGAAVVLLPTLVWYAWRRARRPGGWRPPVRFVVALAPVLLLAVAASAFAYRGAWHDYRDYNKTRASLSATPRLRTPQAVDRAASIGWSRNDLRMFRAALYDDPEVFYTQRISTLATGGQFDSTLSVGQALHKVAKQKWHLLALPLAATCLLAVGAGWAWAAAQVVWLYAVLTALSLWLRAPGRVSYPTAVIALVAVVLLVLSERQRQPRGAPVRAVAAVAAVAGVAVLVTVAQDTSTVVRNAARGAQVETRLEQQLAAVDAHGVFVLPPTYVQQYLADPLTTTRPQARIVALGWTLFSPPSQSAHQQLGIPHGYLPALATDHHLYFVGSPSNAAIVNIYGRQHFHWRHPLRQVATVHRRIGPLNVYVGWPQPT